MGAAAGDSSGMTSNFRRRSHAPTAALLDQGRKLPDVEQVE